MIEKNKDICTCEVTPQHLYFSSPDCYDLLGTNAQMNPQLEMMITAKACGMELKKR